MRRRPSGDRTPTSADGPQARRGSRESPGSAPARLLVLGFGNTLRGDDAAGVLAADALAALGRPGFTVESRHQLTPELAELVAGFDRVVFIDAEPAPDGTVQEPARMQELVPVEAGSSRPSVFGHHQDPRALLGMAQRLYGRTPCAWLVTIGARSFELGAKPSLPCARGIKQAVALVEGLADGMAGARRPRRAIRPPVQAG